MNFVTTLMSILFFATLVEAITTVIKGLLPAGLLKVLTPRLIAAAVGILIAVLFEVDIFLAFGFITRQHLVAYLITGLILSTGSSAIHELLSKLRESRALIQTEMEQQEIEKIGNLTPGQSPYPEEGVDVHDS